MPPVRECPRCGDDVPVSLRCPRCTSALQRARRHPGYDDPVYRRHRAAKQGKLCERCGLLVGAVLHHRDGDPGNNPTDGSNYLWACKTCASLLDEQMRAERRRARQGAPRSPWK